MSQNSILMDYNDFRTPLGTLTNSNPSFSTDVVSFSQPCLDPWIGEEPGQENELIAHGGAVVSDGPVQAEPTEAIVCHKKPVRREQQIDRSPEPSFANPSATAEGFSAAVHEFSTLAQSDKGPEDRVVLEFRGFMENGQQSGLLTAASAEVLGNLIKSLHHVVLRSSAHLRHCGKSGDPNIVYFQRALSCAALALFVMSREGIPREVVVEEAFETVIVFCKELMANLKNWFTSDAGKHLGRRPSKGMPGKGWRNGVGLCCRTWLCLWKCAW
eukprot:RCo023046